MTIVRGTQTFAAPCCGRHYSFPRYVSVNFSAYEYWTDGWREHSLMPNDEGLRRCECGSFVLVKDMAAVDEADGGDRSFMKHVCADLLPQCIAQAVNEEVEVAARLGYWRHLNHAYRERYREHRDAEEAVIKAKWEALHPDTRRWWDRLRGRKRAAYARPANSPFTFPAFEPTLPQLENMQRLSRILLDWHVAARGRHALELAELCREQGRFDEAESVLSTFDDARAGVTSELITQLTKERETAPMRYAM
jgi:hypothetical protein